MPRCGCSTASPKNDDAATGPAGGTIGLTPIEAPRETSAHFRADMHKSSAVNEYKWRLEVTASVCDNFPMHSLDNDELAATALAWRTRACQGEPGACDVAQRLEVELARRLSSEVDKPVAKMGVNFSSQRQMWTVAGPLETRPSAVGFVDRT